MKHLRKKFGIAAIFIWVYLFPVQPGILAQDQLFWQVSGKGITSPAYLLGTIHTYPETVLGMDFTVLNCMKQCSGLVLETHLDWKMLLGALFSPGAATMGYTGETMDEATTAAMHHFFVDRWNLTEAQFSQALRSHTVPSLNAMAYAVYGIQRSGSMEETLSNVARKTGLPVAGLDNSIRQLNNWYTHYNMAASAAWQGTDKEAWVATEFFTLGNIYAAYGIQDTAALYESGNADIYRDGLSLVAWRNRAWMKKLPGLLQKGSFIAVGAAHLHGPNGVLNLLRSEGYILKPITTDFRGTGFWKFIQRYSSQYDLQ